MIPIEKFESYLENKGLKKRTIEEYIYYFLKFQKMQVPLSNESIARFMSEKGNRNIASRSFLMNLKKFLTTNHKELNISLNELEDLSEIELPQLSGRPSQRLINYLTIEQAYQVINNLEGDKHKIMGLLSFNCGLRIGELLKIKISSFNWNEWKKDVSKMGELRVFGKGDKEGIALVPSDIMKKVANFIRNNPRKYTSPDNFMFIKTYVEGKALLHRAEPYRKDLLKAGLKCGITQKDASGRVIKSTVINTHKFRKSYATHLLNVKKLNLREVQELMRHSSIMSTQIYTFIDKEQLKERLTEKKEEVKK